MDENTRVFLEKFLQTLMLSTILVATFIFCKNTQKNLKELRKDEKIEYVNTLREACSQTTEAAVVTRWKCDVCDTKWRAVSIFNKKIAPPKQSERTYRTELQLEIKGKKKYKPYEVKLQL